MKVPIHRPEPRRRSLIASLALAQTFVLSPFVTQAHAATVALQTSTGGAWTGTANNCTYSAISTDSTGNVRVTCTTTTGAAVNGVCGSANGSTVTTTPTGTAACSAGPVSGMNAPTTAGGDYTWTCAGVSGGTSSPTCTAHQSTAVPPPPPVTPPPVDAACGQTPAAYTVVEPDATAYSGTWRPYSSSSTFVAQLPAGAGVALKLSVVDGIYPYGFKITDSTGGSKSYVVSRCPGSSTPVSNQSGTSSINGDSRFDNCKVNNGYARWVNTSGATAVYYAGKSLAYQTTCFLPRTTALGSSTPATYYINILNTGKTAVGVQYSNNPQIQ